MVMSIGFSLLGIVYTILIFRNIISYALCIASSLAMGEIGDVSGEYYSTTKPHMAVNLEDGEKREFDYEVSDELCKNT